jgi:hypothetical protein
VKAPIEMPTLYVAQQQFEPQRIDAQAPEASGRIGGVQVGFPLWGGVWTLSQMPEDNSDEWRAFLRGIRGATRRFVGRDLTRQFPKLYPDGFGAFGTFTGQASSWSQITNSDGDCLLTLHLGSDAAGLELSQGDYVDFRYNATETAISGLAWRAIVAVTAGGTADGSGNLTVTVEPPIPSAVPGSAIAHIDETGCVMVIDVQNSNLGPVDRLYSIQGGQIVGVQDIRS